MTKRPIDRAGRRLLLKAGIGLGVSLACAPADAAPAQDAASDRPREGDWLVRLDDATHTALAADDVKAGAAPIAAWPMDPASRTVRSASRLNQVLIVRLDPAALSAATRERSTGGIVAYTAICTHNGCDIDDWIAAEQLLSCSCHDSRFDPKDGAKVIDGPAPRVLPALPLKTDNGTLVVAAGFTSRVGFEPGAR